MVEKIRKSDEEQPRQLTPEAYRMARDRDVEKRFSYPGHDAKVAGA